MIGYRYFVDHKGKKIETGLSFINVYEDILIDCTTMEQEFCKNEKHYCIRLLDIEEYESERFKKFEDELKKF